MKQHRYRYTAAIVLAAAVSCTLQLGVGQTFGRYENAFSVKEIYRSTPAKLISNYLSQEGRTVLLSDWTVDTASRVETILFETEFGSVSGTLQCTSDSDLIQAQTGVEEMTVVQHGAVSLTMTPTEAAQQLEEDTLVTIRVTWTPETSQSDALWADFQVLLKPAAQEEPPAQDTETEEPSSEEIDEPAQQASEEDAESDPSELEIVYPEAFAKEEYLVLQLSVPEGADTVTLTYQDGHFPENTGYAVGEDPFTALADPMTISIPAESGSTMTVLLDLRWISDIGSESVTISAAALADEQPVAVADIIASPTQTALGLGGNSSTVLMEGKSQLSWSLQGQQDSFSVKLEQLVRSEKGTLWQETEMLPFTIEMDENSAQGVLTISNSQGLAPAGTYRLTLHKEYEGVVLQHIERIIFLHYG